MADSAEKETDAFLQQEAKDGNKGEENDAETVMKKPNGDTAPRAEEEDTDDTDDTDDDDNDDNKDEDDDNDEFSLSFLPFSVKIPNLNFTNKEFDLSSITYLMYLTSPLYLAMVTLGFLYKDDCPADIRLPRYLFFGGLAGLMVIALKTMLVVTWIQLLKNNKLADPKQHPGLNLVRVVMYIFFVFMIMWNINACYHVFHVDPDLENIHSDNYCYPPVFYMSFVLVIIFVSAAGVFLVGWTFAIVAGLCNPDFLLRHGYLLSLDDFHSFRKRKDKKAESNAGLSEKQLQEMRDRRIIRKKIREMENAKRLKAAQAELKADQQQAKPKRSVDLESNCESYDEDRATLSIVRFAQEVNSRRISIDYNREPSRLDITNFPSGPLLEEDAKEGEEVTKESQS